jgi:2-polyprenyl-3-methyl-5-hydroxy-6-metoxy-1,4-benzoquinol methylase
MSCPICGTGDARPLAGYSFAHLVQCRNCRLVFAGREPSDQELAANYSRYPRIDHVSAVTRTRYRALLEGFGLYRRTNRILDIGCGLGFFLEEAQAAGWKAYGSEFEARAVQINCNKGLRCFQAPVTPTTFGDLQFDVITAFEVVEHLRDLAAEAHLIASLLRPGGLFYCTTPNFASLSRRLLRNRWVVINYPEHLIYFTPSTLRRWLAGFGLRSVKLTTTGFTPMRRADGEDELEPVRHAHAPGSDDPAEAACGPTGQERLRETVERSALLRLAKDAANALLGPSGVGDTIKGHFELDGVDSAVCARAEP